MPDQQPQCTRAEELKRLLMEEPTAANEYLRSNLPGLAEGVSRLREAVRAFREAVLDLTNNCRPTTAGERC